MKHSLHILAYLVQYKIKLSRSMKREKQRMQVYFNVRISKNINVPHLEISFFRAQKCIESRTSSMIFTTKWDPSGSDEVSRSPSIYGNIPLSRDLFRKQMQSTKGRVIKMYIVFRIRANMFQESARKTRNMFCFFFYFNLSTGYIFMYFQREWTFPLHIVQFK